MEYCSVSLTASGCGVRVDLESVSESAATQEYTLLGMPVHYVSAHKRNKT